MSADRVGSLVAVQIEATKPRGVFESTKIAASEYQVIDVAVSFSADEVHEIAQAARAKIDEIEARPDR